MDNKGVTVKLDAETRKELDDIHKTVHALMTTKQDRIKPIATISFIIWMLTVTGGGAWWAATITSDIGTLQQTVISAAIDRYHSKEADKDFSARDQMDLFLQQQINTLKQDVQKLEDKVK